MCAQVVLPVGCTPEPPRLQPRSPHGRPCVLTHSQHRGDPAALKLARRGARSTRTHHLPTRVLTWKVSYSGSLPTATSTARCDMHLFRILAPTGTAWGTETETGGAVHERWRVCRSAHDTQSQRRQPIIEIMKKYQEQPCQVAGAGRIVCCAFSRCTML